jgi:hypothetical protein
MSKNILKLFVFLVGMMALSACGPTKENYLKSFTQFVEDVEQNCSSYSDEEWEQKNEEFAEFIGVKKDEVKDQFTSDDQRLIGELEIRYQKAKVIDKGKNILESVEKGIEYVNGVIDGIFGSNDKEEKK